MMRNLKLAFLASALLVAPGCLGGYQPGTDPTPGSNGNQPPAQTQQPPASTQTPPGAVDGGIPAAPSSAKPQFDSDVAPILAAKCGNTACHGGTGTNPPMFAVGPDMYTSILNYADLLFPGFDKTNALLITKIMPGPHNATTYTADELTKINNWLDAEKASRSGMPTVSAREKLLEAFSGCMTQTDFDKEGVASAWANKRTDTNNTACQQCHINGQDFLANSDSMRMFNILSTAKNPYGGWFLEMYFTVDQTTDPANPKVVINDDFIKQAATGMYQHEKFDLTTDRGGQTPSAYTRLMSFYTDTMAHMTAGTCGPNKLGTTPP
jgi:hypothetical protein